MNSVKSFFKSRTTPTVYSLLSIAVEISSTSSITAIVVDLFVLKPYWCSLNKLCLSMKSSNLCTNWENREIGLLLEKRSISRIPGSQDYGASKMTRWRKKYIFQNVYVCSQNFCVLQRNFAFTCKEFTIFSGEYKHFMSFLEKRKRFARKHKSIDVIFPPSHIFSIMSL